MADVAINADCAGNDYQHGTHSRVDTDKNTHYQFFVDADDGDLYYVKSTDGGATNGCPVSVVVGDVKGFDVWYDKWTNGDTGTNIHILYLFANGSSAHKRLNVSSDALSTAHTFPALGDNVDGPSRFVQTVSITNARGGQLEGFTGGVEVAGCGFNQSFATSTDNGDNWTSKADLSDDTGTGRIDRVMLMPGVETDTNDILALVYDDSATKWILKTYDQSGNTWSCGTDIATAIDIPLSIHRGWDATTRHSDNHTIMVIYDINTAFSDMDIIVYDITDEGTITAKTAVLSAGAFAVGASIVIDQNSDDLYVFYVDSAGSNINAVDVFYVKSTDDAGTWSCPVAYSEGTAAVFHEFFTSISIGTAGGRVGCAWSDRGSETLFFNKVNSVEIAGSVDDVAPGNLIAKLVQMGLL